MYPVVEVPIRGRLLGRLDRRRSFDLPATGLRAAGQLGAEQIGTAGQARVRPLALVGFCGDLAARRVRVGWGVSEARKGFVTIFARNSGARDDSRADKN